MRVDLKSRGVKKQISFSQGLSYGTSVYFFSSWILFFMDSSECSSWDSTIVPRQEKWATEKRGRCYKVATFFFPRRNIEWTYELDDYSSNIDRWDSRRQNECPRWNAIWRIGNFLLLLPFINYQRSDENKITRQINEDTACPNDYIERDQRFRSRKLIFFTRANR